MAFSFYLNRLYTPFYLMLLIAAWVLSFLSYRSVRDELSKGWRMLFISLRCLLFFFVFSALFALTIQVRFRAEQEPNVAVLLDYSASMDESKQDSTRLSQAKHYMSHVLLPSIGNQAKVSFFLFSDNIYAHEDSTGLHRASTMIGTSIDKVSTLRSPALSALFLLSDGRNTSAKDPLAVAERSAFPIYTIGMGEPSVANNLRISGLRVNPVVYVGDSVPVSVILGNTGQEQKNISMELFHNGNTIARTPVPSIEAGIELPVQLLFVPEHEGIQRYEAMVESNAQETNTEDNRRSFSVRVLKKRKRVVLLCHQLNWDYRFLREFLTLQKDIEPYCAAMISNGQFLIQQRDGMQKGTLLKSSILPADVVILINPRGMKKQLFDAIVQDVSEKGTGLLIMGNRLPAFPSFIDHYPLLFANTTSPGDAVPVPTLDGHRSSILSIKGTVPDAFPPLSDPLPVRMAKPGATVYLETTPTNARAALPLFSSITCGNGRIAALSAENLWHWKTLPLANGSPQLLYETFLNNVFKWLIARRETERLVLSAERTQLLWGEPLTVSAGLYDDMGNPQEGGIISIRIEQDTATVAEFTMKDVGAGNYEKTIPPLSPGTYTLRAQTTYPPNIGSKPFFSFEVETREIEKLNTEPDHLLLRNIADASGGRFLTRADGLEDIHLAPAPILLERHVRFAQGFIPLLLIALIFFSELLLRKRKGLR